MLLTAAYCAGRLTVAWMWRRATHADVDVAHVAMGVAMAGMLLPSLRTLSPGVWESSLPRERCGSSARSCTSSVGGASADGTTTTCTMPPITSLTWQWFSPCSTCAPAFPSAAALDGAMSTMGSVNTGASDSGVPLVVAFLLLVAAVWYGDSLTRFTRQFRSGNVVAGDDAAALVSTSPATISSAQGDADGGRSQPPDVGRRSGAARP